MFLPFLLCLFTGRQHIGYCSGNRLGDFRFHGRPGDESK